MAGRRPERMALLVSRGTDDLCRQVEQVGAMSSADVAAWVETMRTCSGAVN